MAKLPKKLVQAPAFDSPLRRTTSPDLSLVDEVEEVETAAETPLAPDASKTEHLPHRLTVRLSRRQWEAVQTECFRLRMLGRKTNAAALVRDVVDSWIARQPASAE